MYKECADDVTISPWKACVKDGTKFECSSTHGHPGPASYYWTRPGSGEVISNETTYTAVDGGGLQTVECAARYTHGSCPEYSAACHSNVTFTTFSQYALK